MPIGSHWLLLDSYWLPIGFQLDSHRHPHGCPLGSYWIPLDSCGFPYDPVGFPYDPIGFLFDFKHGLWYYYPFRIPLVSHGLPNWVPIGLLIGFPMGFVLDSPWLHCWIHISCQLYSLLDSYVGSYWTPLDAHGAPVGLPIDPYWISIGFPWEPNRLSRILLDSNWILMGSP